MDNIFFDDYVRYIWEFKNKGYAHFDSWYCKNRLNDIYDNIKNTGQLNHKFYPFIRVRMTKPKKDENGRIKKKSRYIMHTARIDSNIYSIYRNILMNKYEQLIKELQIDECVIAYRKIPTDENIGRGKCNIHFANDAIQEIQRRCITIGECSAITMDIKKFFDTLSHDVIKNQWCRVMNFCSGMPNDHYSVYKNITKYRYIDEKKLKKALKFTFHDLREKGKKQICSPKEFRKKVKPILSKKNNIGIPQGTAISDVIANMYMIDFDTIMKEFANKHNGYYRRYSDDILFICPLHIEDEAMRFILDKLSLATKTLKINNTKTVISRFHSDNNNIICSSFKNLNGRLENINKPFEYLGLSFDGNIKKIRQSTISCFYRKLSVRLKKEVAISRQKLITRGFATPTKEEVYNNVNFKMIRNNCMANHGEIMSDGKTKYFSNFYSYVQLASKITKNDMMLDMFSDLGSHIKKRCMKYVMMIR